MRLPQMYSISGDIHKSTNSKSLQPTWWKSFRKQIKASLVDPQVCSLQQSTTIVQVFSLNNSSLLPLPPSPSSPFKLHRNPCSSRRATRRSVQHWRPPALQQRPDRWLSFRCRPPQLLVVVQGITRPVGSPSPSLAPRHLLAYMHLFADVRFLLMLIKYQQLEVGPARLLLY